jgi:hypothetical protein
VCVGDLLRGGKGRGFQVSVSPCLVQRTPLESSQRWNVWNDSRKVQSISHPSTLPQSTGNNRSEAGLGRSDQL